MRSICQFLTRRFDKHNFPIKLALMHHAGIEDALDRALSLARSQQTPPTLFRAMRHAVFPGGARVRPRLFFAVAQACSPAQELDSPCAMAVAAAIELLHCASLVHDDLPCFDDAAVRRGRPSVVAAFGEPLAVLAGDALIVLAFELLSTLPATPRMSQISLRIARSIGANGGMIAGQAWESEQSIDLRAYHRAKTGALFEATLACGAEFSGHDPKAWSEVGSLLGEAYQVADDLYDVLGGVDDKPVGQDAVHGRPNAVSCSGIEGALTRFQSLVTRMHEAVPDVPGRQQLSRTLLELCARLVSLPQSSPYHHAPAHQDMHIRPRWSVARELVVG